MITKNRHLVYVLAWVLYLLFSLLAYPYLKITVMLASIPLTMLGGWLFLYRGVISTTALTILYHYLMLTFMSSDAEVIKEAFNVFGITLQVGFSCGVALLRKTHDQLTLLNNSLESIVEQQTKDLQQLTNYLLLCESIESARVKEALLRTPLQELKNMQLSSALLRQHLQDNQHPLFSDAATVEELVQTCIRQLQVMAEQLPTGIRPQLAIQPALDELAQHVETIVGGERLLSIDGDWQLIDDIMANDVYHIIHEAVLNAIRHGKASHISIHAKNGPGWTRIRICNNGNPIHGDIHEGMGMPLMRNHAERIGATLSINTSEEGLTTVECIIPRVLESAEKACEPPIAN
jgi:two-component sensor histidine kinase